MPIVTGIVNRSITTSTVPESLKHALVTPIIKKSNLDPGVFSNYRPISNLPYLSKCLERVIASQLQEYLQTNGLMDTMQSAYRPFYSTETVLVKVMNDFLLALDKGQQVALVLLDLSAAFDTIDHGILLHRLHHRYGITDKALQWIASYLHGRSQSVKLPHAQSSRQIVKCGVPQGSVLGPVLFNLYMGPLGDIISGHDLQYVSYADDTQLYVTFNNDRLSAADTTQRIEQCSVHIRGWMSENKLKLNDSKTEFLRISSRYRKSVPVDGLSIGDTTVHPNPCVKDLGLTLDEHLSMDKHIRSTTRSAVSSIRYIGRLRRYLDKSSCERLVHAFVISKVDYCNSVLYGLPAAKIGRIQRVQNTAARLISRSKRSEHITPVLHDLHWLPVQKRIEYKLCLLVFKSRHQSSPGYISDLLHTQIPSRSLRSANDDRLLVPRTKTKAYGDRAFSVCAPRLWNSLPPTLKQSTDIVAFKRGLKTHLFKEYYIDY